MKRHLIVVAFLSFSCIALNLDSSTIVLKNGKTIQGQIISEDDDTIVIQDSKGVKIKLKRSTIDLQATIKASDASGNQGYFSDFKTEVLNPELM